MKSLLKNRKMLTAFVKTVVPPLQGDEVFIALLAARKKYFPDLPRSQEIVAREIIRRNDVDYLIRKIRKLSVVGFYEEDRQEIPPQAFAVYFDLNPKSCLKAFRLFANEVNAQLYDAVVGEPNFNFFKKLDIHLFSAIHRSNSHHYYWCIDIDDKTKDTLVESVSFVGKENVAWISETCNGFHLIVKRNEVTGKKLFLHGLPATLTSKVTIKKAALTPVPGTLQGGFLVRQHPVWRSL